MLLKRFYDAGLAQASYLVGCEATGEAVVIDANRDVEQYVRAATDEKLRLTHVTETHIHADYVSGSRELAARTGATLLLSDEGGDVWRYAFPTAEERAAGTKVVLLRDGDQFMVGNVRVDVMHTPGHTPEHLTFLVTDTAAADRPMGAFTGDFLFVGDVGRPDLLERAAGVAGTMDAAARQLFASLRRFRELPDWLQLWPGHGAGSACGKALGAMPQTTLGYEKLFNWGLATTDEEEFVRMVLAGQPEPPTYFATMKRLNREGPPLLHGFRTPRQLPAERITAIVDRGGLVVDARPMLDYANRHVPGTLNIPWNKSFSTWAGWLVPYDAEFHLILPEGLDVVQVVRELALIGLDRVGGYFAADALASWVATGRRLETVPQVSANDVAPRLAAGEVTVVDVRGHSEWAAGHLPGVANIPLGHLESRLSEIPDDLPVVVHCQGGGRSAIAASILRRHGRSDVANLAGGFAEWERSGNSVEGRDGPAQRPPSLAAV